MELTEILLLTAIFSFGGFVKGMLGLGLPALLIGLLTFFYEPRAAVSMILITITTTNVRQALVGGSVLEILRRFWVFCSIAVVFIFIVAVAGRAVPAPVLSVFVGLSMVLFALTNLFLNIPKLPLRYDKAAQVLAAVGSGILGGLTAIWGPPLLAYLMSLRLDKNTFVQALGVIFVVQSLPLTLGFVVSGELDAATAILGTVLLLPTFAGMYFGEKLRHRIASAVFYRTVLIAFLLLGLNLIRRGLF